MQERDKQDVLYQALKSSEDRVVLPDVMQNGPLFETT